MKRLTRKASHHNTIIFLSCGLLISTTAIAVAAQAPSTQPAANIALGAKYTLSPRPSYVHCTEPGDATQLTDGQLVEGHFWTQKGTVGWRSVPYVTVTVDMGRVEPISGVSWRTAAGAAGVSWPAAIRIHVSYDGKTYHDVGDLVRLDESEPPRPSGYAVRTLVTHKLRTHGQYIRFMGILSGAYLFVDEVEVFRGPDSLLQASAGGTPVKSLEEARDHWRMESAIRRRFEADATGLAKVIGASGLPAAVKENLGKRATEIRDDLLRTRSVPQAPTFRAILPFNDRHADLFGIQARVWKETGHGPLTAWAACPWDPLELFPAALPSAAGQIEVHTMRGEFRCAAFNLANTTDKPIRVSIRFAGIPEVPTPAYVTVCEVPWTDTVAGQPVAAALPDAPRTADGWQVSVLPGLIRQVWLTFHVTDLPAGEHRGNVVVETEGSADLRLPLRLHVYPLSFPARTTLQVGGWSYTDGPSVYAITPANHKPLVEHLRSRFVNAPWATAAVMSAFTFGESNPPRIELDTRRFDDWLDQWPDAAAYFVFSAVGNTFAGAKIGTEAFNQRVGIWISAWVKHLEKRGVQPDQLGLLLVDEPRTHEHDDVIIPWAKAIRAAEPRVRIWEDPIYHKPADGRPEMYELSHILCPNRPMWLAADKSFAEFYLDQQKRGRTLQLYSCSGPARLLDPYSYYRLQAWHCWKIGATGSFFWAFGDAGRTPSSWNEYLAPSGPYTPLFLDAQSITAAKQMEGIRESVEDYEYFVMLRQAVDRASAAGKSGTAVDQARSLLEKGAGEVLDAQGVNDLGWLAPKDRAKADAVRIRLLQSLTELTSAN